MSEEGLQRPELPRSQQHRHVVSDSLKNFERYNPECDHWESRAPVPDSRFNSHLAAVSGRLYLVGGTCGSSGNPIGVTSILSYNPLSNAWSRLDTPLEPRSEGGCAVLNNRIFVVGGYDWTERTKLRSAEMYDVEQGVARRVASIPLQLIGLACCTATICDFSPSPRMSKIEFPSEVRINTLNAASPAARKPQGSVVISAPPKQKSKFLSLGFPFSKLCSRKK